MESVLNLYNNVKKVRKTDVALLDKSIRIILSSSKCDSIEKLFELISEKKQTISHLDDCSSKINKELVGIREEIKELEASQDVLANKIGKKELILLVVAIVAALGETAIFGLFFNLPALIVTLISYLYTLLASIIVDKKLWKEFYDKQKDLDQLKSRECALSVENEKDLFESIRLNNEVNNLNSVVDTIISFLEGFVYEDVLANPKGLIQDKRTKSNSFIGEVLEGKSKSLC